MTELLLHLDVADGEAVWWAESPALPGFTAAAGSLAELRTLVDELGILYSEQLDAPEVCGVRIAGPVALCC